MAGVKNSAPRDVAPLTFYRLHRYYAPQGSECLTGHAEGEPVTIEECRQGDDMQAWQLMDETTYEAYQWPINGAVAVRFFNRGSTFGGSVRLD